MEQQQHSHPSLPPASSSSSSSSPQHRRCCQLSMSGRHFLDLFNSSRRGLHLIATRTSNSSKTTTLAIKHGQLQSQSRLCVPSPVPSLRSPPTRIHSLMTPRLRVDQQSPLHTTAARANTSNARMWAFGAGIGVAVAGPGLYLLLRPAQLEAEGASSDELHADDWEEEDIVQALDGQSGGPSITADRPLAHLPFSALVRSYIVYTLCRFPVLVDAAPTLINWAENTSLPFVASLAHWVFRRTFFDQFVGGETAEQSMDVIRGLDALGLGTIFAYSVEHLHDKTNKDASIASRSEHGGSALQESLVQEILHSVQVGSIASSSSAHDILVAIKLSGLLRDPHILERASAAIVPRELFSHGPPIPTPPTPHQGSNNPHGTLSIPLAALPAHEQAALRELWQALRRVTVLAKERGNVRLLIDAEYSWYQPAIDAMYEALAAEFNALSDEEVARRGPLVFNTFQAYLRRTPSFLSMSLERARAHGYALGVKLVRGAYVEIENKCWRDTVVDPPPTSEPSTPAERANLTWGSPVWPTKRHSDECFDACARLLVDEVARDWRAEQEARARGKGEEVARRNRRTAVVFASHNLQSGLKAVRRMVDQGLALAPSGSTQRQQVGSLGSREGHDAAIVKPVPLVNLALAEGVAGRISFGQLYGMADTVSARLLAAFAPDDSARSFLTSDQDSVKKDPSSSSSFIMVYKYLPYGPLDLVMPYLIRRATENKSVVGGGAASREVSAVCSEMWRRLRLS